MCLMQLEIKKKDKKQKKNKKRREMQEGLFSLGVGYATHSTSQQVKNTTILICMHISTGKKTKKQHKIKVTRVQRRF